MNGLIYLVGLIVVIMFILSLSWACVSPSGRRIVP
jgi:hypothetical protein